MIRHYIERGIVAALAIGSLVYATQGKWNLASYLLLWAFLVDFDDWTVGKGKRR